LVPKAHLFMQIRQKPVPIMDALTAFGLFAVTAMLVCYAMEDRSSWFILAFAGSCALGSAYGFLQGAWPFGVVEAIWAIVALRRWQNSKGDSARSRNQNGPQT
jgi:hypothetical protein